MTTREILIEKLNTMTDEQIEALLHFISTIIDENNSDISVDNDEPLAGFLSGSPDLAERSEEILQAEFGKRNSEVES